MSSWLAWLISFAALVMAIILHEVSHGYAALALGDDTAKQMGRLSLNPIRHVDRVGTILVPGVLLLMQMLAHTSGILFGWAKPVPVAAWRFANPRRGMMLVALAGPLANFVLAFATLLTLRVTPLLAGVPRLAVLIFLGAFLMANLALGTFNLLPLPPLDGGRVLVGLLPERAAMAVARLERFGILLVLLAAFVLPSALAEFGLHVDLLMTWLQMVGDPIFRTLDALAGYPHDLLAVMRLFGFGNG